VVILAERDSVVDVRLVAEAFGRWFPHPDSRLIWYGGPPPPGAPAAVQVKPAHLPEMRIESFSHMGVLFSPDNPEYGPDGAQRNCHNGQPRAMFGRCLSEPEIWWSAWGHRVPGKVLARLTFNPWFDWQAAIIGSVLLGDAAGSGVPD
jgi:hypothetical protein